MDSLKIVIVDDEKIQREHMTNLVNSACKELDIACEISTYASGEELLFELEDSMDWQIVFLDIEMKKKDGMKSAMKLRKTLPAVHIIFSTAYAEYAVDGYKVNALDYLLKPVKLEDVIKALRKYLAIKPQTEKYSVFSDADDNLILIRHKDIISLEVMNKKVRLVYYSENKEKEIILNSSLSKLETELNSESFVKPHRSYLINLDHVDQISTDFLLMSNLDKIPLSRRLAADVQRAFIQHYKGVNLYE